MCKLNISDMLMQYFSARQHQSVYSIPHMPILTLVLATDCSIAAKCWSWSSMTSCCICRMPKLSSSAVLSVSLAGPLLLPDCPSSDALHHHAAGEVSVNHTSIVPVCHNLQESKCFFIMRQVAATAVFIQTKDRRYKAHSTVEATCIQLRAH